MPGIHQSWWTHPTHKARANSLRPCKHHRVTNQTKAHHPHPPLPQQATGNKMQQDATESNKKQQNCSPSNYPFGFWWPSRYHLWFWHDVLVPGMLRPRACHQTLQRVHLGDFRENTARMLPVSRISRAVFMRGCTNPKDPWGWHIQLHLVDFYGKCGEIYHTRILWVSVSTFLDELSHIYTFIYCRRLLFFRSCSTFDSSS